MAKVSKDHVDKWYDYSIDLDNRTLWLGSMDKEYNGEESGVEFCLTENIIKGLHLLEANAPSGDKPIHIIMNNPGGEEIEGLAIYDAIRACKSHVTITVYGKVFSMAGYILQAADERVMAPNAFFMLHEGSRELGSDHPRIIKRWNQFYDRLDKRMFAIFFDKITERNPKFTKKKLEEMLKFDCILSAEETVELGLADRVLK